MVPNRPLPRWGAMAEMSGTITIVQESRFQLTDEAGAAHLFLLGPNAAAEPSQLPLLAAAQTRIRVRYKPGDNVTAFVAERIDLDEATA